MKSTFPMWTHLAMAVVIPAWLLAVPAAADAQTRGGNRGAGDGGSRAAGGDGGSRAAGGGGGSSPAGGGGGTSTVVGTAVPRGDRGGSGAGNTGKGATGDSAGAPRGDAGAGTSPSTVPPRTTARDGNVAVGRAAPRTGPPAGGGGGIFVPGGGYGAYYPWGFGGLGLGGYYGGYYDPYGGYYDPYGGGYSGYPQSGYPSGYEGKLRLKVKPTDATVSVDGYYVGVVDSFDGVFQRLHIEAGLHRIDISAPGYEPLTVDVRIEPDQTVTYHGELKKLP